MKEKKISISLTVYDSVNELPPKAQALMKKAVIARENAYAPYSKFNVGAALRLENNEIVIGNNQENAAYPSGLCAERVAIYSAGARFPNMPITSMALTASSQKYELTIPTPPCGACRQAIAEYENRQKTPIEIYFMGKSGKVVKANSIESLLPLIFDSTFL